MRGKSARQILRRASMALFVGAIGFGPGCAGPQKESVALEQAREAYYQARNNPQVAANAPVALHEAGQTLRKAEKAEDEKEQRYLAYLAQRRAQIAMAVAEGKEAEKQIAALNREMLVESSRIEAEKAATAAKKAQTKAEQAQREAQEKARENERLKEELSQLKAEQTARGLVITLSDILFEFDRSDLTPGGRRTVDQLAAILKGHPDRNVLIEGFTDSVGSPEYNLRLSTKRAGSVAEALAADGISPGRIAMKGYGAKYPVATNDTNAGRQLNRRVEITVLNPGVRGESLTR